MDQTTDDERVLQRARPVVLCEEIDELLVRDLGRKEAIEAQPFLDDVIGGVEIGVDATILGHTMSNLLVETGIAARSGVFLGHLIALPKPVTATAHPVWPARGDQPAPAARRASSS